MPLNNLRKMVLASTISAVSLVANNGILILANDLGQDAEIQSIFEEASNVTSTELLVDGERPTQLRPDDDFDLSTSIVIKGRDYKSVIKRTVDNLVRKDRNDKTNATLDGLNKLTGSFEYVIEIPYRLDNRNVVVNCDSNAGSSVILSTPSVVNMSDRAIITTNVTIKWGDFLSNNLPHEAISKLRYFNQEEDFPDLNISLTTNRLGFDISDGNEKYRPNYNQNKTITGKFTSSTIKSDSNISLKYNITSSNDFYAENKEVTYSESLDSTLSIPSTSSQISIVQKKTRPNKPSNRPGYTTPSNPSQEGDFKVIRMYNPNSGEHLFTLSEAERINLVAHGWKVEQCDWWVPAKSNTPIYRLYNPNNGDHHYTTNASERDMLVGFGWSYEGPALYSADADGIPIYRMYNPNAKGAGSHHYTDSIEECNALRGFGWNFEGIAWYGTDK